MRRLLRLAGPSAALGLLLTVYGAVLFLGEQFSYRDAAHFYYPLYGRVESDWDAGRLPLWEPEENAGTPLLGNPTAAVLYPGKLIYRLAPSYAWGARLYIVAHTGLAVLAMVALLRSWNVSGTGAWIGGIGYGFGVPILFQYCNVVFLVGAAWTPLGLRAADRWLRLGQRWGVGSLAFVLAMQVLGGDPESAYLVGICAFGYGIAISLAGRGSVKIRRWIGLAGAAIVVAAWIGLTLWAASTLPAFRDNGPPPEPLPWMGAVRIGVRVAWGLAALAFGVWWLRKPGRPGGLRVVGLVGSAGLAACLTGAQLLPVMEFTGQSARAAAGGIHDIYPFSLEPIRVAELAFPNLFGTGVKAAHTWLGLVPGFQSPSIWVPSLYLGSLTLILAVSAFGFRNGPPGRAWLSAIAIAALLGSFGRFASPIWVARGTDQGAEMFGRRDVRDDAAIRFDGQLRDGDGGVYWLLATLLPGFREFRYPSKLLTFSSLALAGLAGMGWDSVVSGDRRRRASLWALSLAAIGGVGLASAFGLRSAFRTAVTSRVPEGSGGPFGPFDPEGAWRDLAWSLGQGAVAAVSALVAIRLAGRRPMLAGAVALGGLAIDLGVANRDDVLSIPQSAFEGDPELNRLIREAEREAPTPGGYYRVHRMPSWEPIGWRLKGEPDRYRDFARWERKTLQPKYGINLPGFQYTLTEGTAELYDYVFNFASFGGIHAPELAERILGDRTERIVYFARRSFDLWNTRYFILPIVPTNDENRGIYSFLLDSERIAPPLDLSNRAKERWASAEDWQLLRNPNVYPRSWVVHRAVVVPPIVGLVRKDREELTYNLAYQDDPLWQMKGRTVQDPTRLAWVETDDRIGVANFLAPARGRDPIASEMPRIVAYDSTRVEIEVELQAPGLVILADVYYPGWRLTIDGKPATVYRTNRAMRGALVPAGPHRLIYRYEPGSLRLGFLLTALGLFATMALALWSFARPIVPALAPDPETLTETPDDSPESDSF